MKETLELKIADNTIQVSGMDSKQPTVHLQLSEQGLLDENLDSIQTIIALILQILAKWFAARSV